MSTTRQANETGNYSSPASAPLMRLALGCIIITTAFSVLNSVRLAFETSPASPVSAQVISRWLLVRRCSFWRCAAPGWFTGAGRNKNGSSDWFRAGLFLIILAAVLLLISFPANLGFDLEHFLAPNPPLFGQVQTGRISPVSSLAFLLTGLSFLLQTWADARAKTIRQPGRHVVAGCFFDWIFRPVGLSVSSSFFIRAPRLSRLP